MKEKFFLIALLLCWKKKVGKSGKGIYDMMEIIPPRKNSNSYLFRRQKQIKKYL